MKTDWKKLLPYAAVTLAAFYLLPLLIRDTGSGMAILMVAAPLACLVCGLLCGFLHQDRWLYPTFTLVSFFPVVFLYLNRTALPYCLIYACVSMIGVTAGRILARWVNRRH